LSRRTTIPINCPACGRAHKFGAWQSLNVTLDPQEKPRLLDGSLTRFTCEGCGHHADVVYPLLYHDMEKQLMLWLLPEGGGEDHGDKSVPDELTPAMRKSLGPSYTYRRVGSHNALREKIYVFDSGLDDRVIEVVKLILWEQMPEEQKPADAELLFGGLVREEDGERLAFTILTPTGGTGLTVPRDPLYQASADAFLAHDTSGGKDVPMWPRVDREFAVRLIQRAADPSPSAGDSPALPANALPTNTDLPPLLDGPRSWWKFWE
jgi:CpXC motif protein